MADQIRSLRWVSERTRDEVRSFPQVVRREIGIALRLAQHGQMADAAKPMVGFGRARVFEIAVADRGNAYRAIYVVQLGDAVWVLHAFQKKSRRGIKTPQEDIQLIRERLKRAQEFVERG